MTQGGSETGATKRRSLLWKGRFSRTSRQLQQGAENLEQKQLSPPSHTTSKLTNGDTISYMDNSDNISIHSDWSSDTPGEPCLDSSTMTKAQMTRNKDFHETFKQAPLDDILLHEFKCALQKDVLLQGRLYITQTHIYFKSNILGYITMVELKIEDIKHLDRVRTLRFMPRVIQLIMKNDDKYTFTSFLASLSARDEAFYSLEELWHQGHPPVAPSSTSSASSTTTIPPPSTSMGILPPSVILSDNDSNYHESNNATTLIMKDAPSLNKDYGSSSTANQDSGHFMMFHRRRAHTVSARNEPPNRERSATSSSTPLIKNTNGHISWMDSRKAQPGESKPLLSSATSTRSSSRSSILKNKKQSPSPTKPQQRDTNNNRPITRNNFTTIFALGGFVLLLSHLILTYEFYHVTQLFNNQQQQQHHLSIPASHHKQQLQDTTWISGQLKDVKNQAEKWEQETLRQRKKLLDLIPS